MNTSDSEMAVQAASGDMAAFQVLRGGRYTGKFSYDDVVSLAQSADGEDRFGYRAEFINLVRPAMSAAALEPGKR
ncbi:MAG: YfbK domain-containing protein [Pseudomonadota bacterium]